MPLPKTAGKFDAAAYLAWEEAQPVRNEYIAGEVFAMVGVRQSHNVATLNVATALRRELKGTPCRVFIESVKTRVEAADCFFYPDVVVSCDARDRTRVTLNGFTSLGLVEITRKRTRESLSHVLCEPCPVCQGRGEIKTAQTVCYEILREVVREHRQFQARGYRILAAQQVIDLFLDEESHSLAMLADFVGKPVTLQVEAEYNQEQFDVVLL